MYPINLDLTGQACLVHGGGFAGCVQALMPDDYFAHYKTEMERSFGKGSCRELKLN